MLTLEQFAELEVGDQIEAGGIFHEITDEPIVMLVSQKASDRAEFVATYMGVTLGRWVCSKTKKGLSWVTR